MLRALTLLAAMAAAAPFGITPALAQTVAFGGMKGDAKAPVDIAADALSVDQGTGQARFSGHVVISQGEMRLAADRVDVTYAEPAPNGGAAGTQKIRALTASGGVTLVRGPDAAEAREAVYDVASGLVTLKGDVVVTQGPSVMSGETMTLNLTEGTAQVSGRVRTILQPGGN